MQADGKSLPIQTAINHIAVQGPSAICASLQPGSMMEFLPTIKLATVARTFRPGTTWSWFLPTLTETPFD
jgi:hypothetical protein